MQMAIMWHGSWCTGTTVEEPTPTDLPSRPFSGLRPWHRKPPFTSVSHQEVLDPCLQAQESLLQALVDVSLDSEPPEVMTAMGHPARELPGRDTDVPGRE